jgi:hypothetical protein
MTKYISWLALVLVGASVAQDKSPPPLNQIPDKVPTGRLGKFSPEFTAAVQRACPNPKHEDMDKTLQKTMVMNACAVHWTNLCYADFDADPMCLVHHYSELLPGCQEAVVQYRCAVLKAQQ